MPGFLSQSSVPSLMQLCHSLFVSHTNTQAHTYGLLGCSRVGTNLLMLHAKRCPAQRRADSISVCSQAVGRVGLLHHPLSPSRPPPRNPLLPALQLVVLKTKPPAPSPQLRSHIHPSRGDRLMAPITGPFPPLGGSCLHGAWWRGHQQGWKPGEKVSGCC